MLPRLAVFLRTAAVGRIAALLCHLSPFRSGLNRASACSGPGDREPAIRIPAEGKPRLSSDRAKRRCDASSRRCRGRAAPSTASPPCDHPASERGPASTSRDGDEATELSSLASQSVAASPTHRIACRVRRAPATIATCARGRAPRADARCARASRGSGGGATMRRPAPCRHWLRRRRWRSRSERHSSSCAVESFHAVARIVALSLDGFTPSDQGAKPAFPYLKVVQKGVWD